MTLVLTPYKPVVNTPNDPDKIAAAFTAIETEVNGPIVKQSVAATILNLGRLDATFPALKFGADDWQLYVNALVISEIVDSPNLTFRFANGAINAYNTAPTQVLDGQQCGVMDWQAHDGTSFGIGNTGKNGYLAWILARTVGNATTTNRGGRLEFYTTVQNDLSLQPTRRLILDALGDLYFDTGGIVFSAVDADILAASGNNAANPFMRLALAGDGNYRHQTDYSGKHWWGNGTTSPSATLALTGVAQMQGVGNWQFLDGVATKTKAGTPTDADFTTTPPVGTIVVDTTGKIWARTAAATWKGVTVT